MQISANFNLRHVVESDTAFRLKIDNSAPPAVVSEAINVAVNVLEPLAIHFGVANVEINSWFRCEALEKAICKDAYVKWCAQNGMKVNDVSWQKYFARKQHPRGNAVDLEVKGVSNKDLFEWCKANLVYDQLILEFHKSGDPRSGWVHISYVPRNNRKQAFSIG